jgi:N-acetylglutamate synthase-like GNAT family acetyltransferase
MPIGEADLTRCMVYFIFEENTLPAGCVAYENPGAGFACLNRLSVLPSYRNRGMGAHLVQHIIRLNPNSSCIDRV